MMMPGSFVLGPTSAADAYVAPAGAGRPRAGRDAQGSPSEADAAATMAAAAAAAAAAEAAGAAELGGHGRGAAKKDGTLQGATSGGDRRGNHNDGSARIGTCAGGQRRRPRAVDGRAVREETPHPAPQPREDPPLHHNLNHHCNSTSLLLPSATLATRSVPILHQTLDAAHERLAALLRREGRAQGGPDGGWGWGLGRGCHHHHHHHHGVVVDKPRFLVRKRGTNARGGAWTAAGACIDGSPKWDGGDTMGTPTACTCPARAQGPEGRQPAEECDPRQPPPMGRRGRGRGRGTGTGTGTLGGGIDGSAGGDDGDVGGVYRRAGLDRHGQVVRHVHRLAAEVFGESDEIVEIAMSYLDRYLMAKADPSSLTYTINPAILSGATNANANTNAFLDSTTSLTPDWSIVYASLACLQIAIKTHSPHGDRLSHHRPAEKFLSAEYWDALDDHRRDGDPHVLDKWRVPLDARMVADLEALGAPKSGGGGREIRNVLVRTEADILHTLEFRLVPTTGWGVARDLMDIVETSVQIERLAYERFRQQQAARMAEDAMMAEDADNAEEDKAHRLAGPAAAALPPPYPIRIDSPRLTKLTNCQLSAALYDNDLLSIPRSILARAAVQNALVQLNEESKAAHGLAGMSTEAEVQAQYEAGCAIVGRLAGALRGACSIPYGEAADMDWDSTEEEYEKESMFQFAVQSLGKHLSHVLQQEAKSMAAQNEAAAQKEEHGNSHVVTPSSRSNQDLRPGHDKEYGTMEVIEAKMAKSSGCASTADTGSALDFASERHHRAKKAKKVKKIGIGRLLSGYSPGCCKSGRVILE